MNISEFSDLETTIARDFLKEYPTPQALSKLNRRRWNHFAKVVLFEPEATLEGVITSEIDRGALLQNAIRDLSCLQLLCGNTASTPAILSKGEAAGRMHQS